MFAEYFLIVTMGANVALANRGFGGVSITPTQTYKQCLKLKELTRSQIEITDNLYFDDAEIVLRCVEAKK